MKRTSIYFICFVIYLGGLSLPLTGEQATTVYRVQRGDTLSRIARRFRTSVGQIAQMNDLNPRSVLLAGRSLRVPNPQAASSANNSPTVTSYRYVPVYYRVRPGDTLSEIASRHRTSVGRLASWNRMQPNGILRAGRRLKVGVRRVAVETVREGFHWQQVTEYTRVQVPYSYQLPTPESRQFDEDFFSVHIFAEKFAQGNAAYLELRPHVSEAGASTLARLLALGEVKLTFRGEEVPVDRTSWGYRALFAIPPDRPPGDQPLQLVVTEGGQSRLLSYVLPIRETNYPMSVSRINLGDRSRWHEPDPEVTALIQTSQQKKNQIFAIRSANQLSGQMAHPRDMHRITSPFFIRRKSIRYYRENGRTVYQPPTIRPHRGLDLRGFTGAPIYAIADGRVVCAQRMYYEGNYTVIDHGHGVFSGYMHQSRFLVSEGDRVEAAQEIGKSGATGMATGPHLHLGLWIRNVPVNPLSLLSLPIRE